RAYQRAGRDGECRPAPGCFQGAWHTDCAAQVRVHATRATRRPQREDSSGMKPDIHPQYVVTTVTCSCGNTFTTRSTAKNGQIHAETCSAGHPFYTGTQRALG